MDEVKHRGIRWRKEPGGLISYFDEVEGEWRGWSEDAGGITPPRSLTGRASGDRLSQRKPWLIGIIAAAVIFVIWAYATDDGGGSYSGELVGFQALDAANLEVVIEFTNTGDESASGECTVRAHDPSRSVGFDIMGTPEDLAPGESESFRGAIRIEDEGALRVQRVEVTDCDAS
jgi:hypothetical protein